MDMLLEFLSRDPPGFTACVVAVLVASGLICFTLHQAYQRLSAYYWRFKEDGTEFSQSDYFRLCYDCQYGTLILPPTFVVYKRRTVNKQISKYLIDNMLNIKEFDVVSTTDDSLSHSICPLICFVNAKSGGNLGKDVLIHLRRYLNPMQVHDLCRVDPLKVIQKFSKLKNYKILACGGDGTVSYILEVLDKYYKNYTSNRPPVAILPLGTGNDLSRVLNWGKTFTNVEDLPSFLESVTNSAVVELDRWEMTTFNKKLVRGNKYTETKRRYINNYFGIGVDAKIVLDFHNARNSAPHRFFNRHINKLWYGVMGWHEILEHNYKSFNKFCVVYNEKGKALDIAEDVEGVILSNISSYAGGTKLWKGDNNSMSDGYLEALAVEGSLHLAQIKVGMSDAIKLNQGYYYEFELNKPVPVQVDGEPWIEPVGKIVIKFASKALMLRRQENNDHEIINSVMNWASSKGVINNKQKNELLKEFSKRFDAAAVERNDGLYRVQSLSPDGSLKRTRSNSRKRNSKKIDDPVTLSAQVATGYLDRKRYANL